MPTTIDINVNEHNPVRNEIRFRVEGEDLLASNGSKAGMGLFFDPLDMPGDGDTITINFDPTYSGTAPPATPICTILFSSAPDPNLSEALSYTSGDIQTWIEDELLPVIRLNYFIDTNYTVYYSAGLDGGFAILAREFGDGWAMFPTAGGFTEQLASYTNGTPRALEPNAGLLFQVWEELGVGSDIFDMVLELVYPPDENLQAELFGLNEVLRANPYLDHHMPEPDMTTAAHMIKAYTRFRVKATQRYGSDPFIYTMISTDNAYCYLAGRKEVDRVNYPDWADQVLPGSLTTFLTAWPNTTAELAKKVFYEQREFLAFIVPQVNGNDVLVKLDLYYTDGTSTSSYVLETIVGLVRQQLYMIAVGIEARALDAIEPTKTILRYNVRLTLPGGSALSARRWFEFDATPRPHKRQLHLFNSQGGVDTIPLFGERVNKPEMDMVRSERITLGSTTLEAARDNIAVLRTMSDAFEVGTCYLHQDELEALKELFASERVVERVGVEHWPVEMLTDKGPNTDEGGGITSTQVKYRYALRNTANS